MQAHCTEVHREPFLIRCGVKLSGLGRETTFKWERDV